MNPSLFPEQPENVEALSVEELTEALAAFREAAAAVTNRTADTGNLTMPQIIEQFEAARDTIVALQERLAALSEADESFESRLAELGAEVGVEAKAEEQGEAPAEVGPDEELAADTEDEPKAPEVAEPKAPEVAEVVPAEEVEALAAAASLPPLPPAPRRHATPRQEPVLPAFTASAGIPKLQEGSRLDKMALASAVMAIRERNTVVPEGVREDVVVASVDYKSFFPEDRVLRNDSSDQAKIDAVHEEVLTAAGGICALPTPIYDLYSLGTTRRPVRDALAQFNAARGAVSVAPGLSIADIDDGVGVVTAANDALGGTFAAKGCQVVTCPTFAETAIQAIYKCLQFGNFNARTWPELVAAFNDAALVAHARRAEAELLDGIDDNSTDATQVAIYGAASSLIYAIVTAAAGLRSRHRMDPDARMRVLLPEWSKDLLLIDIANGQFGRFEQSRAGIAALLAQYGVNATFYLDSPSAGTSQIIGSQSAGALTKLPASLQWFIYPEGSFLFLDGGTLDLGIVRDSTLNSTNDYQIFAETFEAVAFVGVESLKVTSAVCPDGRVAAPETTEITCA